MALTTSDVCDAHPNARVVALPLRDFGGAIEFAGPVTTLAVHEDNALVRTALEEAGQGRVLVIDGRGSTRSALVGGNLATLAAKNGWAGIVVHGAIRDAREIRAAQVGVKALGTCPRKSTKTGAGERDVPVSFGGVTFRPGEYLVADEDGVVVLESRGGAEAPW